MNKHLEDYLKNILKTYGYALLIGVSAINAYGYLRKVQELQSDLALQKELRKITKGIQAKNAAEAKLT